jgi:hypothetical protein
MSEEISAADRLYAECARGAEVELPEFLAWLADRLVHVYGESPLVDYVQTARDRARRLRAAMDAYRAEADKRAYFVPAEGVGSADHGAVLAENRLLINQNKKLRDALRDIAERPDRVEWRAAAMMARAEEALKNV